MLYRFRTCNDFLFDELEKKYIYFSDIKDFNDYGENNINLIFEGDIIAWRGFLRHYISSLFLTICFGKFEEDSKVIIHIEDYYNNYCQYPLKLKDKLKRVSYNFLEDKFIKYFLSIIVNEKVSHRKLTLIMSFLQVRALLLIYPIDLKAQDEINKIASFELFKELLNEIIEANTIEKINKFNLQLDAITMLPRIEKLEKGERSITIDFSKEYLQQIKMLLYPDRYVACFSERFDNNAMWGYYANSFKGICLEFKTDNERGKEYIELYNRIGVNEKGNTYDWEKVCFQKVIYGNNEITFPEINFFDNIGRISIPYKTLFLSENSKESKYFRHDEEWRDNYWKLFDYLSTHKLSDWEHEKEQRLITDNTAFDFSNLENRKLKYNFNSLDGIIFGNKIEKENKDRIIEIIAKNCIEEKREDFNFYNLLYINGILEKQICIYSRLRFKKILEAKIGINVTEDI